MTPAEYRASRERIGTQTEVAALLGVTRRTIISRESSATPITREAALAIQALAEKAEQPAEG